MSPLEAVLAKIEVEIDKIGVRSGKIGGPKAKIEAIFGMTRQRAGAKNKKPRDFLGFCRPAACAVYNSLIGISGKNFSEIFSRGNH